MKEIIFYRLESGKSPVEDFLDSLSNKQFEKVAFVFDIIEGMETVSQEYFKKLTGTEEIWEVRVQQANTIFRFLGFLDDQRLVVLNHAFTKKTRKTPKNEIKIAEQRRREYYKREGKQ